jgi:hypothetical protein
MGHTSAVCSICITRENKFIISGGNYSTVRTWSLSDRSQQILYSSNTNSISALNIGLFILIYKHYATKFQKYLNFYLELNTLLILIIIGAYIKEDLYYSLYNKLEWSLMILISCSITIPVFQES